MGARINFVFKDSEPASRGACRMGGPLLTLGSRHLAVRHC
jgi:hypothetical protein